MRTARQAQEERLVEADKTVERLKRGVEAALAAADPGERRRIAKFCEAIGLSLSESPGAGLEFAPADALVVLENLERTPAPAPLARHLEF